MEKNCFPTQAETNSTLSVTVTADDSYFFFLNCEYFKL